MKKQITDWESRNVKSTIRLLCWTFAWIVTMLLADKAELYQWHSSELISILSIIVNTGIGFGMIMAFMRYLKGMDELQRKIQLNSLALSMGVGFVGGSTFSLLATVRLITDVEYSDVLLLMALTYMAGVIIGQIRYR
jgi:hypothetical protein